MKIWRKELFSGKVDQREEKSPSHTSIHEVEESAGREQRGRKGYTSGGSRKRRPPARKKGVKTTGDLSPPPQLTPSALHTSSPPQTPLAPPLLSSSRLETLRTATSSSGVSLTRTEASEESFDCRGHLLFPIASASRGRRRRCGRKAGSRLPSSLLALFNLALVLSPSLSRPLSSVFVAFPIEEREKAEVVSLCQSQLCLVGFSRSGGGGEKEEENRFFFSSSHSSPLLSLCPYRPYTYNRAAKSLRGMRASVTFE